MPRIKTTRTKPPPNGYDEIEQILDDYKRKMRDAETDTSEGKRKNESNWPIYRIEHMRTRYIYNLFYTRNSISRELYDWLLKEKYADAMLIAKWKKNGYESLCCVRCIQSRDMNNPGSTCICRVPSKSLGSGAHANPCAVCGCKGCSSSDQASGPKISQVPMIEDKEEKEEQEQEAEEEEEAEAEEEEDEKAQEPVEKDVKDADLEDDDSEEEVNPA